MQSSRALTIVSQGQLLPKGRSSYSSWKMTHGVIWDLDEGASQQVCGALLQYLIQEVLGLRDRFCPSAECISCAPDGTSGRCSVGPKSFRCWTF